MQDNNIRQIKPGDIYYKSKNWFYITICSSIAIDRKEGIIKHHCVTEDLDFCLVTEMWVEEKDCDTINRLRKAGY